MEEVRLTKRERRALAKEEKKRTREKNERAGKLKKWSFSLVILLGLLFAGYKFVDWFRAPDDSPDNVSQEIPAEIPENEWVRGNQQANVTLIEYSDFQCPACGYYSSLVERLGEEFPNDLKIVYKHFPLGSESAFAAALATEAAGKQGMFWQMHDILFERQAQWSEEEDPQEMFVGYAQELGLDENVFLEDFAGDGVKGEVDRDLALAQQLGLNSTPTFFLNDEKIQPKNYDEFKELIETQIRGYTIE